MLGSLIIGRYNRFKVIIVSKFIEHDVTWSFNAEDMRGLTVQVKSITIKAKTGSQNSFLLTTIANFETYPYLPRESCVLFKKTFSFT